MGDRRGPCRPQRDGASAGCQTQKNGHWMRRPAGRQPVTRAAQQGRGGAPPYPKRRVRSRPDDDGQCGTQAARPHDDPRGVDRRTWAGGDAPSHPRRQWTTLRPGATGRWAGRVGRRCMDTGPTPPPGALARARRRPDGSPQPPRCRANAGPPQTRGFEDRVAPLAGPTYRPRRRGGDAGRGHRPCRARRGAAPTWTASAARHRSRALRLARAAARRRAAGATLGARARRGAGAGRRPGLGRGAPARAHRAGKRDHAEVELCAISCIIFH